MNRTLTIVVLLFAALAVGVARADGRPAAPTPAEIAAQLPDDVDLVLIVSNASRLRSGPLGEMTTLAIENGVGLSDISKAWMGLAEQLGWTKQETFDRLLGGRVVVVTRPEPAGVMRAGVAGAALAPAVAAAPRTWAVLSEVDEATEKRLFERLQAAPRAIDAGHQILAIEKGAYELTSHRGAKASGKSTIVLGPAGRSDLFDELVRAMANGAPRPLSKKEFVPSLRGSEGSDICLMAALAGPEAPGGGWLDFAIISARMDTPKENDSAAAGLGWSSNVIIRQHARRAELEQVRTSSDAVFEGLAKDSLLAIVQSASVSRVLETEVSLMDLFKMLPIGGVASPGGSGPQAASDGRDSTSRQMLCVRTAEPRDRTVVTVGVETPDVALTARRMDDRIASVAATLERRFGSNDPPPIDLGGASPGAARVLHLRLRNDGLFQFMLREPLVLSWMYPQSPVALDPAVLARPGWWVLTVSQSRDDDTPTPAALVQRECRSITDPARGRDGRWVWLGSARPRELEARLPVEIPDIRGFRSVMRAIEFGELRLSISDVGDIRGDIKARLAPSSALPAGAPAATTGNHAPGAAPNP